MGFQFSCNKIRETFKKLCISYKGNDTTARFSDVLNNDENDGKALGKVNNLKMNREEKNLHCHPSCKTSNKFPIRSFLVKGFSSSSKLRK